ncbi:MAPK/MAK/MRK overlapping kinase-like [Chelonus insularis]|uniref:MAPK/MAK/MRK overlapping kinase-like n=1 Tax=Chelonus insularis TaxID=460826 RepID=UPI00158B7627|nr:MAPK/MAK/MRK overlapping kinase-like [Chelonus insularis]
MSTSFLKKYKVIRKIGEGSFSEVLKCQDRLTGVYYAGKRLKKIYHTADEILKIPEIIAMRKISRHPNVLYMIESHYDPLPGKVTLIFDLMDMNLYDMIKKCKNRIMSEQKVKMYLYQLLKGLEHLHKHGMFHRDIKPENILLKGDVIKLADLGSIRAISSKPPYTEYISTRWYRSPECLLTNGHYGPKMDIWATGCVFYELLTLKPLFPGSDEVDQITKIHTILGTPHAKVIAKFRRHSRARNGEYFFPHKEGIGFRNLLYYVSETGQELLKMMLVYDPENRSDVKSLLEHRYFNSFREKYTPRHISTLTLPSIPLEWHNSSVMNYFSSESYKRHKPLNTRRFKVVDDEPLKLPKISVSNSNSHQNFLTYNSSLSKFNKSYSNRRNSKKFSIQDSSRVSQDSWRTTHIIPLKRDRLNESSKSAVHFEIKSSSIGSENIKYSQKSKNTETKYFSKQNLSPFSSRYSLQEHNLYPNNKQKIDSKNSKTHESMSGFLPQIILKPERCRPSLATIPTPRQKTYKKVDEKRNIKLVTITEICSTLPHTRSSNIQSPAKKIAKHETDSKFLRKK